MPASAMQLDGYIRVSRVGARSGDSFISPEVQREQITTWASLRGVTIAAWHTDLDQTGGILSRPGLNAMMERVRARQTGGIVVARLDRLSRAGVADALKLVEELKQCGAELAVVDLGVDPTTVFGEFATTLMLALARLERRRVGENWRIAREKAIGRGVHFFDAVGYSRDDESGRLVPNEHAPQIREVFRRKASGASWGDLARYLNDAGVPTTTGSAWQPRAVAHLIAKRVYLGEAYHGDNRLRDAHDALVTAADWEAANRTQPALNDGVGRLLSGGLVRCASCRHTMKGARAHSGKKVLEQYRCKKDHAGGRCPAPATIVGHILEPYVEQAFLDYVAGRVPRHDAVTAPSDALRDAENGLAHVEEELAAYVADLEARRLLGRDRWLEGVQLRVAAVEAARSELARHAEAATRGVGSDPVEILDLWPELSMPERRKLILSSIGAVFVRPSGRRGSHAPPVEERVAVLFRGDPRIPADLPRKGGRAHMAGPLRPFWPDDPLDAGMPALEDVAERA
jgi:site-specific DNA recombinase